MNYQNKINEIDNRIKALNSEKEALNAQFKILKKVQSGNVLTQQEIAALPAGERQKALAMSMKNKTKKFM